MLSKHDDLFFAPSASLAAIEKRGNLLRTLREFFFERGFLEVETPLLAAEVIPELHIDPMSLKGTGFLQASPELHMKRLLAAGGKAIVQITRSFRAGERGRLHNPEFTIVEWYRVGDTMHEGMDLLDSLLQSLLGTWPAARTTYAEAFQRVLDICPHTATAEELANVAAAKGMAIPSGMSREDRDEWLNLLLATRVEPQLGGDKPEILYHYPATQASLAKVIASGHGYNVAERFEVYFRGIELANGFHELSDASELRRRFESVNLARAATGHPAVPLPETLLAAIAYGLPDCTGCALGFDRLVMLALGARSIDEVIAFPQGPI